MEKSRCCRYSLLNSVFFSVWFFFIIKHWRGNKNFYWNIVDLQCCVSYKQQRIQLYIYISIVAVVYSLSHSQLFVTPWTIRLLCPWDFPGKNCGVCCHVLLHIEVYSFFYILFHYRLLQEIEYGSLCYAVGPYWCSMLCLVVYIYLIPIS